MGNFMKKVRSYFAGMFEKDYEEKDKLTLEKIEDVLREMGYVPRVGSKKTKRCFQDPNNEDYCFEVVYEDDMLDIMMCQYDYRLDRLDIYKEAAKRAAFDLALVRFGTQVRQEGYIIIGYKYVTLMSSVREFRTFFPKYIEELKESRLWFRKRVLEVQEEGLIRN